MHVVGHDLHRLDSDIELCRLLIQEFLQPLVDSINEYRPPVLGTPDDMLYTQCLLAVYLPDAFDMLQIYRIYYIFVTHLTAFEC